MSLLDQPASKLFARATPEPSARPPGLGLLRDYLGDYGKPWVHPDDEAPRLTELEGFLAQDFHTFREVRIECRYLLDVSLSMRIDLLAVPKAEGLDVALAFEVKRKGFDVERALKQSADYVGGRVCEAPHTGKRIAACFLYPVAGFSHSLQRDRYDEGMFNLIAQWRVGRGFVKRRPTFTSSLQCLNEPELTLALGYVVIWRSQRGWVNSKASQMLLGKRSSGGSRKALSEVELRRAPEESA